VTLLGTIFFGWVTSGHTFVAAMTHGAPYAIGASALSLLLPRTAVAEDALLGRNGVEEQPKGRRTFGPAKRVFPEPR
jgi:hypothetical protein